MLAACSGGGALEGRGELRIDGLVLAVIFLRVERSFVCIGVGARVSVW
jgi:hypothetical protein